MFTIISIMFVGIGIGYCKPQKKKSQFGKNKMPPKCDKLSSILTFQTSFKFL